MSIQDRDINKIASRNIRKWLLAEHVQQRIQTTRLRDHAGVRDHVGPYLVVSRESGAGGSEIARAAAERLKWDLLDREILDLMAEKYGTPHGVLEVLDEKRSNWVEELLATWFQGRDYTTTTYIHRLKRMLLLAANHGQVVIVGRGAQFVLPHDRGFAVRIVAPLGYRIKRIAGQRGISQSDARTLIHALDRQYHEFNQMHFHRNCEDPHMYDLVVNVEKFDITEAADLIANSVQHWMETHSVGCQTEPMLIDSNAAAFSSASREPPANRVGVPERLSGSSSSGPT